ncbi:MAG TPA: cytochrome c oxidase assembly protein [Chitinophagaceae bacterium]|jgi:putative membrane protein|nr:cytochrome c oxidase assembly protein [Chitinophagaceae bacterium]
MSDWIFQCSYAERPDTSGLPAGYGIPLLLLAGVFAAYGTAVVQARQQGKAWRAGRTVSFGVGCLLCGAALSPSFLAFAHHDLRGHAAQHALLGMLGPLALVQGAPVSLALRVLPRSMARGLAQLLGSRCLHVAGHPFVAGLLSTGSLFLLYLTPLFVSIHDHPWAVHLLHAHLLLSGYLFAWSVAGPDPAPRRPGLIIRGTALFLFAAAHAFLGKFMYAHGYPKGLTADLGEIRAAAQIMYYSGDAAELILLVCLFATWYRRKGAGSAELGIGNWELVERLKG